MCLWDLNTDTIWNLPARFDWSIIGCTILLLALINLKKNTKYRSLFVHWVFILKRRRLERFKKLKNSSAEEQKKRLSYNLPGDFEAFFLSATEYSTSTTISKCKIIQSARNLAKTAEDLFIFQPKQFSHHCSCP